MTVLGMRFSGGPKGFGGVLGSPSRIGKDGGNRGLPRGRVYARAPPGAIWLPGIGGWGPGPRVACVAADKDQLESCIGGG
jgi:hypothetical protein